MQLNYYGCVSNTVLFVTRREGWPDRGFEPGGLSLLVVVCLVCQSGQVHVPYTGGSTGMFIQCLTSWDQLKHTFMELCQ